MIELTEPRYGPFATAACAGVSLQRVEVQCDPNATRARKEAAPAQFGRRLLFREDSTGGGTRTHTSLRTLDFEPRQRALDLDCVRVAAALLYGTCIVLTLALDSMRVGLVLPTLPLICHCLMAAPDPRTTSYSRRKSKLAAGFLPAASRTNVGHRKVLRNLYTSGHGKPDELPDSPNVLQRRKRKAY